jgi:hypothetical protein
MVAPTGRSCQVRRGVHDVTTGHHRDGNSPGLTRSTEIAHGQTSALTTASFLGLPAPLIALEPQLGRLRHCAVRGLDLWSGRVTRPRY